MNRYFDLKKEDNNFAGNFRETSSKISESANEVAAFLKMITKLMKVNDISNNQTRRLIKEHHLTDEMELVDQNLADSKSHINDWHVNVRYSYIFLHKHFFHFVGNYENLIL